MDAVIASKGGQAEIGNDEPLRCALVAFLLLLFGGFRDHDVDAGIELACRVGHGDGGRYFLVELGRDVHLAFVDLDAGAIADGVDVVARELALHVAVLKRRRQAAVADAVDFDVNLVCVGREDRNALLAARRQHISLAAEVDRSRAVRDINGNVGAFQQRLADIGRKAGADLDLVAVAVLQALEAELFAVLHEVLRVLTADGNEFLSTSVCVRDRSSENCRQRRGGVASLSTL